MVMPNTTAAAVFLAMERHGSGSWTSVSIRLARRSEASGGSADAGRAPPPDVDGPGSASVVSFSSGVTDGPSPVTKRGRSAGRAALERQHLGLLGLELF